MTSTAERGRWIDNQAELQFPVMTFSLVLIMASILAERGLRAIHSPVREGVMRG
jgi:hypothetical protein